MVSALRYYGVPRANFPSILTSGRLIFCVFRANVDPFHARTRLVGFYHCVSYVRLCILLLRGTRGQDKVGARYQGFKNECLSVSRFNLLSMWRCFLCSLGQNRLDASALYPIARVNVQRTLVDYRDVVGAVRVAGIVVCDGNEHPAKRLKLCVHRFAAWFIPFCERVVQVGHELGFGEGLERSRVEFQFGLVCVYRKLGFAFGQFHGRFLRFV